MSQPVNPQFISDTVDALASDLVRFIQTLVQTPSLPNHEHAVQGLIAEELRRLGLDVDIVPSRFEELRRHPAFNDDGFDPEGRVNVVGRWRGAGQAGGHSLILNGHVDVVAPGDPALWSASPWSGTVRDGKLYGRGACDMKAGVATGIFALAALRRLGFQPAGDILMESVIGEESGGIGTLTTIIKGYTADACIVLEPTGLDLCPLQSGALTFRLTVPGKAAHAAMRQHGVSAIEKFALLHQALLQLEADRHAAYHTDLYDDPRYVAPISIGTIIGGEWHSTAPERVVAEGRLGVFPGETTAEARQALEEAIRRVAQADSWLCNHPPSVEWFEGQFEAGTTDLSHPFIHTLSAAHRAVLGSSPRVRGVPYGADLRLFTNHARIPAVLYGAGDVSLAHGVDESITLADVVTATKVVALMVARWCSDTGQQSAEEGMQDYDTALRRDDA
ncbi:MAG: ArgE/DapE family deacylase [Anaerolineae bacterium]|nr:ArgE/DapE family deacylase [Anaerolineae bacterium]